MKFIKKFETFDFSQTIPVAAKSDLTLYYHCDNCNALWKELNNEVSVCKFCKSDETEELSRDEWYESVGERLDDDEQVNLDSDKSSEEETFLDLYNLNNRYVN